jgi:hypothetical protein
LRLSVSKTRLMIRKFKQLLWLWKVLRLPSTRKMPSNQLTPRLSVIQLRGFNPLFMSRLMAAKMRLPSFKLFSGAFATRTRPVISTSKSQR